MITLYEPLFALQNERIYHQQEIQDTPRQRRGSQILRHLVESSSRRGSQRTIVPLGTASSLFSARSSSSRATFSEVRIDVPYIGVIGRPKKEILIL